jgi:hypothetical protein
MEIFVITATNPNDRDLILGLIDGHTKLTYTGATARGNNLNFGRRGLLHLGQLTKNGKRIPFKAKRGNTGMRDNPEYMKAWAATVSTMEQQGRRQILKEFWPLASNRLSGSNRTQQPRQETQGYTKLLGDGTRSARRGIVESQNTVEEREETRKKTGCHREEARIAKRTGRLTNYPTEQTNKKSMQPGDRRSWKGPGSIKQNNGNTRAAHIDTGRGDWKLRKNRQQQHTEARIDLEAQVNKISMYITSNLSNIPKDQLAELQALIAQ